MLLPRSSVEKKRSLSWLTEWLHKDVQHQRGSPRQRSEEAQIAQGAASTSTNSSLEWPYFDMTHGYPTVLSRWTKQIAFCTEKAVPEPLRTPSYVNAIVLRRNQNSRGEKKEKKEKKIPPPTHPHLAVTAMPWSQQECPIKSGLLEMKGTCVHPLSREGIRWEPKHTLLHHEVLRQTV